MRYKTSNKKQKIQKPNPYTKKLKIIPQITPNT